MSFADQVLEFDRARAEGREAPVPVTGGRKVVCVVCPETAHEVAARLGLDADQVVVVAVPAARVHHVDGDVARAVALAAGASGGTSGGADVVVLGHEGCVYRSPTFAVPGPPPQGESFPTVRDLVRHSVAQLRGSPWMARTNVAGFVAGASGRIESAGDVVPAAPGPVTGPAAFGVPGPVGSLAASGPVSFFDGAGAAGPSLASAPPLQSGAVKWESPPPIAPSAKWEAPPPIAPTTAMPVSSAMPSGARTAHTASMPHVPQMPTVGPLPQVTAPLPSVSSLQSPGGIEFDIAPPRPEPTAARPPIEVPPPPKPAPPVSDRRTSTQPAPSPPTSDDPFKRAEEILERLRREKRK
jgi:hypothetical protein